MAERRYVCLKCNRVKFNAYIPSCDQCHQLMTEQAQPGRVERPLDDYTRSPTEFFKCDPIEQEAFEKFMRRHFGGESDLVGYAELGQ